jgi:YYY domain-containing protein
VLTLALGWCCARKVWGSKTALLFLGIAIWVPLDIQQSHFATVEAHQTFLVTLTLVLSIWLASTRNMLAAVSVGVATGLALAVKLSSLPLALPIGVALVIAGRQELVKVPALGAALVASIGVTLWIAQPWMFAGGRFPMAVVLAFGVAAVFSYIGVLKPGIRWWFFTAGSMALTAGVLWSLNEHRSMLPEAYLRGIGEQIDMVTGNVDMPYTRVYRGTLPFFYSGSQLAIWGLGPALFLALLASIFQAARRGLTRMKFFRTRNFNLADTAVVVLAAWFIPTAVRLATLQVKYLRYWQPLVPALVMLVAWYLARMRWRQKPISRAVVVATALWGFLYIGAFVHPHPHRVASDWLEHLVEPEMTVAFEEWDETLGFDNARSQVTRVQLPYYHLPDGRKKLNDLCQKLSRAEWVVLTSNRVRRTLWANHDRFPLSVRLYRALLSGEAGFMPVTQARRGPRFLGLEMPIDRADESFVNYEFPTVIVLRRTESIDPWELRESISNALPPESKAELDRIESEHLDVLPEIRTGYGFGRQLVMVGFWCGGLVLAAASCWGVFLPFLRKWPDTGVGLALVSGWLIPPWIVWMSSEIGLLRVNPQNVTVIWIAWVAFGLGMLWRNRLIAQELVISREKQITVVLASALVVGLVFLAIRASNPAIFWGEKPMDLSFLAAFVNAESWPPGEPWMAGQPLHYYYFGEVLAGFWVLLTGSGVAVGYNIAVAVIPALSTAVLASLALFLARGRFRAAILAPLLVVLTGNLAWPWLTEMALEGNWFDLWWATSRVVPGFAIDEYPLWTAIFADLHAHFLAQPVLVGAIAWAVVCVNVSRRELKLPLVLTAVFAGVLVATNPWDVPVFVLTLALGALVAKNWRSALVRFGIAAALSAVAVAPFLFELSAWLDAGVAGGRLISWHGGEQAPAWAVLRHFGVFWIPLVGMAMIRPWRRLMLVCPIVAAGVLPGLAIDSGAAAVALPISLLCAVTAIFVEKTVVRLAWAVASLAAMLVALCEWVTLIDRMNTLFKVYNGVWILLAMCLAVLLVVSRVTIRRVGVVLWAPLQLVAVLNLPIGFVQGWQQPRTVSPRPTLDGQAYLRRTDVQTFLLSNWISALARPTEAVAEAAGPPYREYTRIAMNTGQPTVLGWSWHLQQRGQRQNEIQLRERDLRRLYTDADVRVRRKILDRYDVRWIVVADVERRTYNLSRHDLFARVPGVVRIGSGYGAVLYRVFPESDSP